MELTFERGPERRSEHEILPADLYNRMHLLRVRAERQLLFIPIRALQYLAIADAEEVIFVDGQGPRVVSVAWRHFRTHDRESLQEPVPYDCVVYEQAGEEIVPRLQMELTKALTLLEERRPHATGTGTVTPIEQGRREPSAPVGPRDSDPPSDA